ncbi:universal stress protein [Pseudonocardia hispaniensis]|uniref:Universal stress protein n=1 Tax=Pseudonocardia hispaniensis TaxID=904933 RepID=A0ABW1J685_9PSEU
MHFIVGYAADDHGREALALGAWLARQHEADLTVAYVVPEEFPIATRAHARSSFPPEIEAQVDEWLQAAQSWVVARGGVRVQARVVAADSPARGLAQLATRSGASMIVLGSSRTSSLRHFGIGTVSGQLLHSSPVALALAPRGLDIAADRPVHRVWCGYAGTARSREALTAAMQLARRSGAPLRLVTFVVPDGVGMLGAGDVEQIVRRHRAEAHTALTEALSMVDADVEADTAIAAGPDVAAGFAGLDTADGDVLVLGSSDAGPVERVFFGGTASRLLRGCPLPVVAVPRGGTEVPLDVTTELPAIRPMPSEVHR